MEWGGKEVGLVLAGFSLLDTSCKVQTPKPLTCFPTPTPNSVLQPFPTPSFLFFYFSCQPKTQQSLAFPFRSIQPLKKENPESMSDLIPQTSNLSDIYPDISQQLFNKHAKLLSELKNRFAQIYDDFEPQKYVIVNGVAKIIDLGQDLQVNFAMENGVTVLYRKTYKNEDIYINGNHLQEEIIINAKGKHIQGIHIKVDEIKDMIDLIRRNSQPGKQFYGGILYIHSNIGQSIFAAQECFMLGVFISLIMLHQEMQKYNKSQLLTYLTQIDPSLSPKIIASLLQDYEMNKCNVDFNNKITFESENQLDLNICDPQSDKSIKTHQSNESIKILTEMRSFKSTNSKTLKHRVSASTNTKSNNSISSLEETSQTPALSIASLKLDLQASNKLILCKLDLSNEQCQSYQYKMTRIKQLNQLIQQQKLNKYDIFEDNQVYLRASAFKDMIKQEEYQLLRYCQENRQLLNNLINHRIEFSQFIVQKHDLDIKYQIFDEEVVLLINQIHKEAPFLKNFCIIQGTVLLISMEKQYYAEIMRFLRRLFNDYKLSTYRFLQTKHKLNEDKSSCEIGEIMFTTSPSLGCAIYNQEENLLM